MFECCRLYVGKSVVRGRLFEQLLEYDYERVDTVADPGQVASRGGIIDIFPATFESPVRIEFHGQKIVSMRTFNPSSLETLDHHSMVVILPRQLHFNAREHLPFESFVDIQEGDTVVHIDHGIGRYLGRTEMDGKDVFMLEYADGDRLYVPVEELHLIQKYVAIGAKQPVRHKLGGKAWTNAKVKAFASAFEYARSLLDVQAKRMALKGIAFPKDNDWQVAFEQGFPYRETPDQIQAIAEVKADMEKPQCMDRVLLGDVGFGKTEVALRAAFKAVMGQKQVAVLVPTTLLAFQHFQTFTERMQEFPIRVEMLSRFQTDGDQRQIIQAAKQGKVDVVIGTHRLLSPDVKFDRLGLLVIDEEQRFGVKAKERIKEWRTQIDVMVLSATPIPRTLYLSMVGARDMSLIATPPENRHPVETAVVDWDQASVGKWITRELDRNGQVYIVHNRVRSIAKIAEKLAKTVPEAKIGIAHGQMHEDELEQVMLAFMDKRIDVLVTTTIIESGIDIPNVNTLIVDQAHKFGLSDLYQLRGRVGRFDRKAFAYLTVPKRTVLTAEARKRLEVMASYTELGSGFKVAMEDLKIRGAGNLLGVEQSGHISAVGFDLYCRLLREAVDRLKS